MIPKSGKQFSEKIMLKRKIQSMIVLAPSAVTKMERR